MTIKHIFIATLLMISAAQCSAMYYEKKVKVYNPWITGPTAALSTVLAVGSFAASRTLLTSDSLTLYRLRYHITAGGCGLIAIIAARQYYKDICALRNYDVKNY